ncbi:Detected protein of unknown function [Hibiscus syriacus]|uniref:Uncharacterized protein n=1 Tax=Hibiscus syriacus TaxID=106335 RepID=A0A6A3B7S9_HIBSY|nr:Detected protein of unknown function [Hibiscus syriacus]
MSTADTIDGTIFGASKSRSKNKKTSKETQKASSKHSGSANAALQNNGCYQNIDETDEHLGGSPGGGFEYDSPSNNGSWSVESEDHKEKTSNHPLWKEIIHGADNDKRQKIRQKNERKHQRQKERRALELHERCNGYLMYKCTRQEVERAVVIANGDLEKAAESLRTLKQDPHSPSKPEATCDPSTSSSTKVEVTGSQNLSARPQLKQNLFTATLQRRDENDLNHSKSTVTMGDSLESVTKSFQPLQPKLEWAKCQKSEASPPPTKTESHHLAVGIDFRNILPSIRESAIMMQQSQSLNTRQVLATSIGTSPLETSARIEIAKSNGFIPQIPSSRSLNSNNLSSSQMHHQLYHQQQQHFRSSSVLGDSPGTSQGNGLWSRTGASPMLAAASSLGLFTGLGSTTSSGATSSGATSSVDWSSGSSMTRLDYTNIWSLDRGLSSSPRPGEIWLGPSTSPMKSIHMYYLNTSNEIDTKWEGCTHCGITGQQSGYGQNFSCRFT